MDSKYYYFDSFDHTLIIGSTGKGFLTSEEQFLDLLNNFIARFKTDFYFLGSYEMLILQLVLENYVLQYEITIKNYYSKKDAISILL